MRNRLARICAAVFVSLAAFEVTSAFAGPIYTVQELFPLPGGSQVEARAINARGDVIGYSYSVTSGISVALWSGGTVQNLSPNSDPNHAYYATDMNDVGQIVGFGVYCMPPFACPTPPFGARDAFWNVTWLAYPDSPTIPMSDPIHTRCGPLDSNLIQISNSGYITGSDGLLASPHHSGLLCGVSVTSLYENGIAVTPEGYLYDPIINDFKLGIINERRWVLAPTCDGADPAYLYGPLGGPTVSNDVKAEICNLVATGYSRNRLMNASGQFFSNVEGRALLYTPVEVPEPHSLALVAIALAGVGFARRRTLH